MSVQTLAKQLINKVFGLKATITELNEEYNANISKLKEIFDKLEAKELQVKSDTESNTTLVARRIDRVTIDYIPEKLKENLSPEVFNEIALKTYTINDMQGLTALLKKAGVNPKEFKQFVDVSIEIDKQALKRLYEDGEITKADLKDCYTAKVVKSISISKSSE